MADNPVRKKAGTVKPAEQPKEQHVATLKRAKSYHLRGQEFKGGKSQDVGAELHDRLKNNSRFAVN